MKKFLKIMFVLLLAAMMLPISIFATPSQPKTQEVLYLDNGDYITVELSFIESRASGTQTGNKIYIYRAQNGDEEWRAVLSGTFTYTGATATCTAASCNVTISNNVWYIDSHNTYTLGNSAVSELTMGQKLLGITIHRESIDMKLSCTAGGNLY